MASPLIVSLTQDNFETEALKSATPIFVDFWAEWCGPCKMIAPVLDELANEYTGKIKIGKVNVDEQAEFGRPVPGVLPIPSLLDDQERPGGGTDGRGQEQA